MVVAIFIIPTAAQVPWFVLPGNRVSICIDHEKKYIHVNPN